MFKSMVNRYFTLVLCAFAWSILSSCNRGYGCPTNMSVGFDWQQVTGFVADSLTLLF